MYAQISFSKGQRRDSKLKLKNQFIMKKIYILGTMPAMLGTYMLDIYKTEQNILYSFNVQPFFCFSPLTTSTHDTIFTFSLYSEASVWI